MYSSQFPYSLTSAYEIPLSETFTSTSHSQILSTFSISNLNFPLSLRLALLFVVTLYMLWMLKLFASSRLQKIAVCGEKSFKHFMMKGGERERRVVEPYYGAWQAHVNQWHHIYDKHSWLFNGRQNFLRHYIPILWWYDGKLGGREKFSSLQPIFGNEMKLVVQYDVHCTAQATSSLIIMREMLVN